MYAVYGDRPEGRLYCTYNLCDKGYHWLPMKTNAPPMSDPIVVQPSPKRLGRISHNPAVPRLRFRILPFLNASGTRSFRAQGMNRDGKYLRQNYADLKLMPEVGDGDEPTVASDKQN
jgi:hypothetical protein